MIRLPALDELARRWSEVGPILKRATDRTQGCYEPIDVLRQAMAGQVGFWFIETGARLDAVVVVEIRQYPRKRAVAINFIAGRRLTEWWPEFVERMDALARHHGCTLISAYGRPGWVRFWQRRGVAVNIASEIIVREL
jgi:hypothetical protein